jgi:hypothetical protein
LGGLSVFVSVLLFLKVCWTTQHLLQSSRPHYLDKPIAINQRFALLARKRMTNKVDLFSAVKAYRRIVLWMWLNGIFHFKRASYFQYCWSNYCLGYGLAALCLLWGRPGLMVPFLEFSHCEKVNEHLSS